MNGTSVDLEGVSNDAFLAELERRAPNFSGAEKERVSAALAVRAQAGGALAAGPAAGPAAAAENPLARFKAQYDALPKGNILAQGSTWETVQARLSQPENADKLKKVQKELQGGGRLYAVMEDDSLEFVDDNSETPPMFVKNNETGELQVIHNRNDAEMAAVRAQIEASTHQWASIQEMLDWVKANGFEVFEVDPMDQRWFGKKMKLAEAASPTKLFVGKTGGPWMGTALKDSRYALFIPDRGVVYVVNPHPLIRNGDLGLLRRLRV